MLSDFSYSCVSCAWLSSLQKQKWLPNPQHNANVQVHVWLCSPTAAQEAFGAKDSISLSSFTPLIQWSFHKLLTVKLSGHTLSLFHFYKPHQWITEGKVFRLIILRTVRFVICLNTYIAAVYLYIRSRLPFHLAQDSIQLIVAHLIWGEITGWKPLYESSVSRMRFWDLTQR